MRDLPAISAAVPCVTRCHIDVVITRAGGEGGTSPHDFQSFLHNMKLPEHAGIMVATW